MVRKIQGFGATGVGGSEKDRYFLKIPFLSINMKGNYRQGKFVFHFSYQLKISKNTEIKYALHFKAHFYPLNPLHIFCLSTF